MIASKGQSCGKCKHCDGYACLQFDVWLDGKIKVDKQARGTKKKDLNYISVLVYGKRYCPYFKKRNAK